VLLDDARPGGGDTRLYRDPVEIITAHHPDEVLPALDRIAAGVSAGRHAAGYLSYEAGLALEPALAPLAEHLTDGRQTLLWFGLFEDCTSVAHQEVPALLPQSKATAGPAVPQLPRASHAAAMERILDYIRAGDIYQANLSLRATVPIGPDPLAVYAAIRSRAAVGHGALVRHDGRHVLSFSPESFFEIRDGIIETRPMKGTARRLTDPAADTAAAEELCRDPKQRAENLMIVDLLRNDLSRVCVAGSVTVPALFTVEHYPTVHQMTSRVMGRLAPGLTAIDAVKALFPCGSITGAPKIRAMEIIDELESDPRGVYTGCIGSIDPDGNARFNVAIRTICMEKGEDWGVMGIGSGIVADSRAQAEWAECLDKARFLGE
jgi:aminodeoxychorismate synthase component I